MKIVIHYAGRIRTATLHVPPGGAACCSGERAEKVSDRGNNTFLTEDVTCVECQRALERQGAWEAKRAGVTP